MGGDVVTRIPSAIIGFPISLVILVALAFLGSLLFHQPVRATLPWMLVGLIVTTLFLLLRTP